MQPETGHDRADEYQRSFPLLPAFSHLYRRRRGLPRRFSGQWVCGHCHETLGPALRARSDVQVLCYAAPVASSPVIPNNRQVVAIPIRELDGPVAPWKHPERFRWLLEGQSLEFSGPDAENVVTLLDAIFPMCPARWSPFPRIGGGVESGFRSLLAGRAQTFSLAAPQAAVDLLRWMEMLEVDELAPSLVRASLQLPPPAGMLRRAWSLLVDRLALDSSYDNGGPAAIRQSLESPPWGLPRAAAEALTASVVLFLEDALKLEACPGDNWKDVWPDSVRPPFKICRTRNTQAELGLVMAVLKILKPGPDSVGRLSWEAAGRAVAAWVDRLPGTAICLGVQSGAWRAYFAESGESFSPERAAAAFALLLDTPPDAASRQFLWRRLPEELGLPAESAEVPRILEKLVRAATRLMGSVELSVLQQLSEALSVPPDQLEPRLMDRLAGAHDFWDGLTLRTRSFVDSMQQIEHFDRKLLWDFPPKVGLSPLPEWKMEQTPALAAIILAALTEIETVRVQSLFPIPRPGPDLSPRLQDWILRVLDASGLTYEQKQFVLLNLLEKSTA